MRLLPVVLACSLVAVACGSEEKDTSMATFVEWLSSDSGAALEPEVAECVARDLWPELSEEEIAEFVELDVEDLSSEEFERAQPSRMDALTEATVQCGALAEP